jgi:hypothetical protein
MELQHVQEKNDLADFGSKPDVALRFNSSATCTEHPEFLHENVRRYSGRHRKSER